MINYFYSTILLMALLLAPEAKASAQQFRWQWAAQFYGDGPNRVCSSACDTAGNIYLTGAFSDSLHLGKTQAGPVGRQDMYLAKFNPQGQALWVQQAGSSSDDIATAMTLAPGGKIYTAGMHGRDATFGEEIRGAKAFNLFVSCYTAGGELEWVSSFAARRNDYIPAITADSAGHIYFGGYFDHSLALDEQHTLETSGGSDAFIACLDSLGAVQWAQRWGGAGNDRVTALQYSGGQLYIAGNCNASMTLGENTIRPQKEGLTALFTARCSAQGVITAVNTPASGVAAGINTIAGCKDKGAVIGGNFSDSLLIGQSLRYSYGQQDMFCAVIDSAGNVLWQQQLGSVLYDKLFDVAAQDNGGLIATGVYAGTMACGLDTVALGNTVCDVFTAAFDTLGALQEINVMGGKAEEFPQSMTHNREGDIFVAGLFRDTTMVRQFMLSTATGNDEVFLAKLYRCTKNKLIFNCDTVFTEGTELTLRVEGEYYSYQWDGGASLAAAYPVACSKTYRLQVTDSIGCVYRDSITVRQRPAPPKVQIRAALHKDPQAAPLSGTTSRQKLPAALALGRKELLFYHRPLLIS